MQRLVGPAKHRPDLLRPKERLGHLIGDKRIRYDVGHTVGTYNCILRVEDAELVHMSVAAQTRAARMALTVLERT